MSAERLRLEVPPNDWSPFTYQRDRNGVCTWTSPGYGSTRPPSSSPWTHDIDPDRLQDTLPVTVDVDLRPSRLPVTAVNGRAHFELPITATSPRQR